MLTIVVIGTVICWVLTMPGAGLIQMIPIDSSQEAYVVGSVIISILGLRNGGTGIPSDLFSELVLYAKPTAARLGSKLSPAALHCVARRGRPCTHLLFSAKSSRFDAC